MSRPCAGLFILVQAATLVNHCCVAFRSSTSQLCNIFIFDKIITMTIFSKIIAGQIPSYKISENEKFFAFLDISPVQNGHTLVIPKVEVDKIFDVPDEFLTDMLVFAKPIAKAIEKSFSCNR